MDNDEIATSFALPPTRSFGFWLLEQRRCISHANANLAYYRTITRRCLCQHVPRRAARPASRRQTCKQCSGAAGSRRTDVHAEQLGRPDSYRLDLVRDATHLLAVSPSYRQRVCLRQAERSRPQSAHACPAVAQALPCPLTVPARVHRTCARARVVRAASRLAAPARRALADHGGERDRDAVCDRLGHDGVDRRHVLTAADRRSAEQQHVYSPRLLAEIARDKRMRPRARVFSGTFLYATLAIRAVGSSGSTARADHLDRLPVAARERDRAGAADREHASALGGARARRPLRPRSRRDPPALPALVASGRGAGRAGWDRAADAPPAQLIAYAGAPLYVVRIDEKRLLAAAHAAGGLVLVPFASR